MTTPEIHHAPSERGTIELIGPSHCTFTRSIALALHELGIPYIAIHRAPHSADVRSLNPYGLTPVLRHRQEGLYASPETTVVLSASHAVRRYIDEHLAPLCSRSTLTPPLRVGDAKSVVERSKCDAWIESISHTLFPAIEAGYVGSALQMRKNGADGETINVALELELNRVQALLEIVESQAKAAGEGAWVMGGNEITWADLFLFPILDDLRASPAGGLLSGNSPTFPWLAAWMSRMDSRPSVKATHEGTVAHHAQ